MSEKEVFERAYQIVYESTKRHAPSYLAFSQEMWNLIDELHPGAFPGIKRVVLPDVINCTYEEAQDVFYKSLLEENIVL